MANDDKKPDTPKPSSFTVDAERTGVFDMPSVTRLLNRKALGLKKPKSAPVQPPPPLPVAAPLPVAEPLAAAEPLPAAPQFPALSLAPAASPSEIQLASPPEQAATLNSGFGAIVLEAPGQLLSPPPEAVTKVLPETLEQAADPLVSALLSVPQVPGAIEFALAPDPIQPIITLDSSQAPSPDPGFNLNLAIPNLSGAEPEDLAAMPPKPTLIAKKAQRRPKSKRLIIWYPDMLKHGNDPLGKGLVYMLEKGATSALFLSITPPPAGAPVPHFVATAAIAPVEKVHIWTGMKWDPTVVPEMWNYFIKAGFVELTPPGTTTNKKSNRNVVRAAFGIQPDEYLLLVRSGPPQACRGVLALVSKRTMVNELVEALPLITSLPAPAKAA